MAIFSFSSIGSKIVSAAKKAVSNIGSTVKRAATTVASRARPSAVTTTSKGRTTQQAGAATIGAKPSGSKGIIQKAKEVVSGAVARAKATSATAQRGKERLQQIGQGAKALGTKALQQFAKTGIPGLPSSILANLPGAAKGVKQYAQGVAQRFQGPTGGTNLQSQFTRTQNVSPNLPNYSPGPNMSLAPNQSFNIAPQTAPRDRTGDITTTNQQLNKQLNVQNEGPVVDTKVVEDTPPPPAPPPPDAPTFDDTETKQRLDTIQAQLDAAMKKGAKTPEEILAELRAAGGSGSDASLEEIQGLMTGQLTGAIPTEGYIVQPGDTLSSIARRTGVAVGDISGYRSGNANLIYPGENLTINRGGAGKTNVSPASAPPASTLPEETALTTNETDYLTYLQEKSYGVFYKTLKEQLGLDDVKDNINDINDKLQKLQDDRAEEEADINNNPWISESLRAKKIQSLGGKYDQKEANLREAIKNSQDVYDDARQEAQFAAKLYIDQANENREFYYKVKQDAEEMKLKREDATPDIQEYKLAQTQGYGGSFLQYQREVANLKEKDTGTGGVGDGQTGIPSISQGDVTGDPFLQTLLQSSGGKRLTDTSVQKLDKAFGVLDQLGVLQNNIQNTKTGPITGLFRGKNPWDTNAQTIKAQLNAIVPNLARGVFGEVGVLTDNDIKQYSKTLPNLTSTEDVRNAVLGITVDMIGRSLKRTLQVNAANKADVSGYAELYNDMIKTRDSIFSTIGQVSTQPKKKRGIGGFVKDFFSELFTKGY